MPNTQSDETIMSISTSDGDGGVIESGPFTLGQLEAVTAKLVNKELLPLTALAAQYVIKVGKCSTSLIQRQFAIGYNKAARIVETLEELGVVTSADHVGKREIVAKSVPDELAQMAKSAAKLGHNKPPMKETSADRDVKDGVYRVTAGELRSFIERTERLDMEKKDIAEQQKEVMAEAKARGYDTKVLRKIVALRKRDKDDIAEEEAVLEMYKEALGM